MSEKTTFGQAAQENLEEVEQRMAEIEQQIDLDKCWDPSVETDAEDMELAHEYDRLIGSKQGLEKIIEDSFP